MAGNNGRNWLAEKMPTTAGKILPTFADVVAFQISIRREGPLAVPRPIIFDSPVAFNAPRHGVQCSQGLNNNKNSK